MNKSVRLVEKENREKIRRANARLFAVRVVLATLSQLEFVRMVIFYNYLIFQRLTNVTN